MRDAARSLLVSRDASISRGTSRRRSLFRCCVAGAAAARWACGTIRTLGRLLRLLANSSFFV